MKYTDKPDSFKYHWWAYIIMPDYASNTVWTWMGLLYLKLLKDSGSKDYKTEYSKFTQLIDRYKTFPELLHPDGSWYKTIFYKAEEGMIWSAIYNNISE